MSDDMHQSGSPALHRLTVPAHCMDEDFLREIGELGVKIVDLQGAPWAVTFEGTAAALREMYDTHWADGPCPEFDKEEA